MHRGSQVHRRPRPATLALQPWARPRSLLRLPALGALLAVVSAGCGRGPRGAVLPAPVDFPSYPDLVSAGGVWAQGTFHTNSEDAFGVDLLKRGLLPVALKVGTRGAGRDAGWFLSDAGLAARLYLQDGTLLEQEDEPLVVRSNAAAADRVSALALESGPLPEWSDAREGFLFFRFDPSRVRFRGTRALSRRPGADRELDLLQSVLELTIDSAQGPRELFVGLREGRWVGR